MNADFAQQLDSLQNVYRLAQPKAGYFLAVVLRRVSGAARVHMSALQARYNGIPYWRKTYRRRRGLPNYRLLLTRPLCVLTNADPDDPDLSAELLHLSGLGFTCDLVDLRAGWAELDAFRLGAPGGIPQVRPSKAVVTATIAEIRRIGQVNGRNTHGALEALNRVLIRFHEGYRWTNAGEDFAAIQNLAEQVLLGVMAKRAGTTRATIAKRAYSQVAWQHPTTGAVSRARTVRTGPRTQLFTLRLAKSGLRFWLRQWLDVVHE